MKKYTYTCTATCPICGESRTLTGAGSKDITRTCRRCKTKRPKTLGMESLMKSGYIRVQTELGYQYKHRLVWEQHNGPIPEGYVIHHIDEDKANNDISNLEIMTKKEHDGHGSRERWAAIRDGSAPPLFKPNKKNIDINLIIPDLRESKSIRKTAETFNTTKGTIVRILKEYGVSYTFDRSTHATIID